jgi:MFS transporter, PAT family, beta-lactamase induction signal transducer AmpG
MMTREQLGGWIAALAVYRDRRILCILCLGFSSGLPLALVAGTLSIWLAELGVAKTVIGLFALVGLPYTLKFLWAPLIDGLRLPFLTRRLGRRRGWAVVTQAALMAAIVALGASDPASAPAMVAVLALLVAFCSASQDIVIDAYRVEILAEHEQGAGAAAILVGYRLAMVVSGAGALYVSSFHGWFAAYAAGAALVLVGVGAILLNPEPEASARYAAAARRAGLGAWLNDHVVAPLTEFMGRPGWGLILLFILLYKFGDAVAAVMSGPFYVELGFSKIEIANVTKAFGVAMSILGAVAGGAIVARLGVMPALLVCGVLQMLSNLMFVVQAMVGHDVAMLTATIAIENLTGGMGTAAFVAYLSALCNVAFTATQYALLSSLMAVGRTVLSSSGGWLADQMSWVEFFLVSTVAAVPGLLLLLWMIRRYPVSARAVPAG